MGTGGLGEKGLVHTKKSKKHDKVVKDAYTLLVMYRREVEDKYPELAEEIQQASRELWCECLNEPVPWK